MYLQIKKKRTPGNKTKREESIPLSKDAIEILKQRKAANDSDVFIFLNQGQNRLDDDNIYRNLKPILKKYNIRDAHPHTFRHTFASHLVIKGVSIYTVKELLRHASVKETEIYAQLCKETTQNAVELLTFSDLHKPQIKLTINNSTKDNAEENTKEQDLQKAANG